MTAWNPLDRESLKGIGGSRFFVNQDKSRQMLQFTANAKPNGPDITAREHVGIVSAIRWRDEESGAVIATLRCGRAVKGSTDTPLQIGEQYRFLGKWNNDPRWGMQFWFDLVLPHVSTTDKRAVVRYLTSLHPDVKQSAAERCWRAFGEKTLDTLREDSNAATVLGIFDGETAGWVQAALRADHRNAATKVELFSLFAGRGFPATLVSACLSKYGHKAPDMIRKNPFRLLIDEMPGVGFIRADKLWGDLGHPKNALKRQLLCGWDALRSDSTGHTWQPVSVVIDAITSRIVGDTDPVKAIELGIRSQWLSRRRDEQDRLWIAEGDKAAAEAAVARHVTRLLAGADAGAAWPAGELVGPEPGKDVSQHQKDAWARLAHSPVAILTGGPGTGKTFTTASILREIVKQHGLYSVAVCAPTGKAAVRCTQALRAMGLDLTATTIHKLLGIGPQSNGTLGFQFHEGNPLPFRFIVVDESSMIDSSLMACLLAACETPSPIAGRPAIYLDSPRVEPPRCRRCHRELTDTESMQRGYGPYCATVVGSSAWAPVMPQEFAAGETLPALPPIPVVGTHVLFVGDPHQLPPVGHGAPLRDLIAAGVASAELTEIRRNSGSIVRACHAIKAGAHWSADDQYDPDAEGSPKNLLMIETDNAAETASAIESLLMGMKSFNPVWQCQVLVAMNKKSVVSRTAMNERLQRLLNPDGWRLPGNPFAIDDKIICLKNGWIDTVQSYDDVMPPELERDARQYKSIKDADGKTVKAYVANGEIGRVVAIGPKTMIARISEADALIRVGIGKVDKSESESESDSKGQGCNFDLAYAITVHKAQGSESPCVIVAADEQANRIASREWVYTALSRASKCCIIVGKESTIKAQARRQALVYRKTFLVELLKEMNVTEDRR